MLRTEWELELDSTAKRIWISLAVTAAWVATTLFGARLITGGDTSLDELVSTGIGWHFLVAIAILVVAIVVFKWNDIGFNKPHSVLRVLWFPAIYLVVFAGGLAVRGVPSMSVVFFVAINTIMVGASEEIMFRGVLLRAFDKAMSIWPAIILTTVLFGAVHSLNGFITGQFGPALIQSVAAGLSGLVFMAILIRTGSIWPGIIYHFLWDFLIFLLVSAAAPEAAAADTGGMAMYGPILLSLPNVICAAILLRHVGREHGDAQQEVRDENGPSESE